LTFLNQPSEGDRAESSRANAIALLNLPNWWLAGGAVRNTVWRSLFGNDCQLVINDFDIAFFDALGDCCQELTAKATLTAQFPDYKFDVKNQASESILASQPQTLTYRARLINCCTVP
jgi:hypothetical protein